MSFVSVESRETKGRTYYLSLEGVRVVFIQDDLIHLKYKDGEKIKVGTDYSSVKRVKEFFDSLFFQ